MAKKMVYVINGLEIVSNIREVCEAIGEKVTKQQVIDGEVDGVFYMTEEEAKEEVAEPTEDDMDDTDEDDTDILANIPDEDEVETGNTEDDTEDTDEGTDEDDTPEDTEDTHVPDGLDDDGSDPERAKAESGDDIAPDANSKHKVPQSLKEKLAMITKPKEEKAKGTVKLDPNAPVDFPEKGTFKEEKELKKFYKKLSDAHLDEWLELEGLSYKPCDNEGINRMRKCMAIKEYHFPSENKGSKKSKSKYANITTEMLVDMCAENDIQLKDSKGDMRILRMYAIMELRKEGFLE